MKAKATEAEDLEDRFKALEEDNTRLQSQLQEKENVKLQHEILETLEPPSTHTEMIIEALESFCIATKARWVNIRSAVGKTDLPPVEITGK